MKELTQYELIDGTASKKSYIVAQHKKDAILAIKPEIYPRISDMTIVLRMRLIADPMSTVGIPNRMKYLHNLYPDIKFTKMDDVRGSYFLRSSLPMNNLLGFLAAENGEALLKRMIYKVVLHMVTMVQQQSGSLIEETNTVIDFLVERLMEDINHSYSFSADAGQVSGDLLTNADNALNLPVLLH